ncbi:DEAD/DEAH box helicase family protein [Paenibacillus macerans]|uniref:DEAD/DEAH box helicase family protein n=1 Tax=Paenibacillus macerans TaxID=44252 RepID=A0A090ZC43_PAEMA|nr:DEAD/DEAH box helicase family protein [Paenibacillus macerans]KFN08187.1 DEAD/DEAH box helicase family protein [Paenibacillus macerans]MBS5914727.1 DEAD/DEAH box helicase family protein [Paenibacillus macerans]MCY7557723.1 DEAD/DEAH box helicase family protein [Paenibacillus macerans]MEC0138153.1 DEAD/DEAH box helicase family protein [Paenibacillus macerans]MEC0152408.1 DEAD/DEAH box helicase family protein [Paenibacillus macerans]
MPSIFETREPNISSNNCLRIPQREAFESIEEYYSQDGYDRESAIILPVGCGKSGLITLTPFAVKSKKTLVIAPGLNIASQLYKDFDPTQEGMFYAKCLVLNGAPYPEPAEIRGNSTNRSDLDEAEVVITNIQQLQGSNNRWLTSLPSDFFDLILVDEAHHNVAESWNILRHTFPEAKIVNYSATPRRADGQIMSGQIIYTFPLVRAIEEGYVKRLKAIVLNPKTLKYVRQEDEQEIEVNLEEVKRLGETDSDFRRSIVTSQETLYTIVDASIRALNRNREQSGSMNHKIIASALNRQHCIQIMEAYRARGMRAAYVHSLQDKAENDRVLNQLKNNQLDVIVQVRKLGEGFDHPFLSVAAIFSVFNELSPFIQFVGRIMRAIDQNAPESLNNQGTVVFHAGSNVARLWGDFQDFSQADREFFDQLLPMEGLDFTSSDEIVIEPETVLKDRRVNQVEIRGQEGISVLEVPLILEDDEVKRALKLLKSKGVTLEDIQVAYEHQPIYTTRQRERQAARLALDETVRNEIGFVLRQQNLNPQGRDLDRKRLGKSNFVILKSAVDKKINKFVGKSTGKRHEFSREELDSIRSNLESIIYEALQEVL